MFLTTFARWGHQRLAGARLWQILAIAVALRVAWALLVPVRPVSDALAYQELAQQLAAGRGYCWLDGRCTAYWPVGTSAFYAGIYLVFGQGAVVVAIANIVLGALLVAAVHALARTGFTTPVANGAALLVAAWPTWIAFTTIIASELPADVLLTAGSACALRRSWPGLPKTVLAAALLTGAAYVRANLLPLVVLVPAVAALAERRYRMILPQAALAAAVGALLIAPWALRNERVLGAAVPISTNAGVNLWIGNHPGANGGYQDPPPPEAHTLPTGEVARDLAYREAAVAAIRQDPGRYLVLSLRRLAASLDRETFGVHWNAAIATAWRLPLQAGMTAYWLGLLIAAVIGLGGQLRRREIGVTSPFVVIPVAAMAAPVLVMGGERYHYPIAPFVAIFAAAFVVRWCGRADPDGARSAPAIADTGR